MNAMDVKEINQRVIKQFRAGGEIEGMHREGLLLLSTTGRKSGRSHTTPMMFVRDGDRLFVMAANAGATQTPDWCLNLIADPHVTVEVGEETYEANAAVLEGAERERHWAVITKDYPFFAEFQVKAGRVIPVVALERA
jgi:deazaflavin-dependent oxidoreductase (nitroreductase family)